MTQEARRPLHRLTPLRDDPAAAWLTPPQRLRGRHDAAGSSGCVFVFLVAFLVQVALLVARCGSSICACPPSLRRCPASRWSGPCGAWSCAAGARKVAELVRDSTPALGVAIDDFADLERQPDGSAGVAGRLDPARANSSREPVGGEPCVGLALACHQRYPGVLETLNDFELVDEAGRTRPGPGRGRAACWERRTSTSPTRTARAAAGRLARPAGGRRRDRLGRLGAARRRSGHGGGLQADGARSDAGQPARRRPRARRSASLADQADADLPDRGRAAAASVGSLLDLS